MSPTLTLVFALAVISGICSHLVFAGSLAYTVEPLAKCPELSYSTDEFVLFDGNTNLLKGWSHVDNSALFKTLKKAPQDYTVSEKNWVKQGSCDQGKVFSAILVKKIGDWNGSHVNGIEPIIDRAEVRFGDVKAVVLEFKIDSANTHLPAVSEIKKMFSFAADDDRLATLDEPKVSLSVTLFEAGFQNQNTPTFNAQMRLNLDRPTPNDPWMRVVIPVNQMRTFLEQHYAATEVPLADYSSHTIAGLRINPETTSGQVARHLNPNAWEQTERPELFKEMGLMISKVAIELNEPLTPSVK